MPKHIDNVPKIADFKAPWESEAGEVEIDKDKLKKYIHNLITDKAKAQDARDAEVESKKVVETERDEYKEQVDSKDPDSGKKITKLEKERDEAKAETAKANLRADRIEVAVDKGLTPAQAKRLQGETKEELEKDADEVLELFGKPAGNEEDEDNEDDEANSGRTAPKARVNLTNGGDPKQSVDQEPDYEKIAAQISGNRVL